MSSAERGKSKTDRRDTAERTRKTSAASGKSRSAGASAPKTTSAKKASTGAAKAARKPSSGGTKKAGAASKQRMKTQTKANKRANAVLENPAARRRSSVAAVYNTKGGRSSASVRGARPVRRAPARKRRKSGFGFISLLLLLAVLMFAGLGCWRIREYKEFERMKAVVSRQTFYAGTTVEGIDVSEMTLNQAIEYWDANIEARYRQAAAVLNDGTRITAEQMGYASDYAEVLSAAWNLGRSGSLVERYNRISAYVAAPAAHSVNRTIYDDARVRDYAASLAAQIDTEPRDAHLKSFNTETYNYEFEPEENGRTLDQEALVTGIENALVAGGGSVQIQVDLTAPQVRLENVAAEYGMISYAITNASSSSSNRLSNIKLALSLINGVYLEPGETFSFNETVGRRTTERGFKLATAYSSGKVTEEVGGGICQVSTTLFNAVVKADLKVNERHAHSLTVSYVDIGKDAAVDWDNKDLRFTNTSDDRVYICCYLTDDKRIRIGVFGKLLADGVTIAVESKKTASIDYTTEYQMNFTLYSGQTRVAQTGKNGAEAMTYKVWYDVNGNEIRREDLCKSRYSATPEIIEYGP